MSNGKKAGRGLVSGLPRELGLPAGAPVGIDDCGDDLLGWIEACVESRTGIAESTRQSHRRLVDSMRESGLFRSFSDLTARNVTLWDMQLKRGRRQSTVYGYHKRLKVYVSLAVRLGLIADSPYRFMRMSRGRRRDTVSYITPEERARVEALPLRGQAAVARDMFVFACYTGLSYCDLVRAGGCLCSEGGRLYIDMTRLKTGKHCRLTVLPRALDILCRYRFDLDRLSNRACNRQLRVIQRMAGLRTRLTMHVARHSFATWALNAGVPMAVVSRMLGHQDIKTTQIYARVLQREVGRAFDLLGGEGQ